MRKMLLSVLSLVAAVPLMGQSASDRQYPADEWAAAFSAEGREQWKPEFTFRGKVGIYSEGLVLSGGVRIDGKRTLGLMLGYGHLIDDAAPGDIYSIHTSAFLRRYVHLGKRDIVALYGDFSIGAAWIYKVTGKYSYFPETGMTEVITDNPGDVRFLLAFEPGVRVRVHRNIHLFLGPTISSSCFGLHLGFGI